MTKGSVSVTSKVDLRGDFFTKDPAKTVRANIRDMLEALSDEMEHETRGQIADHASQMPYWTGHTLRQTKGYVTSPKTGKRWQLWAAVGTVTTGMSAKDAIRTKAAAAGRHVAVTSGGRHIGTAKGIEERWHPFRRVKSAVYRSRALISADLTKGLD